MATCSRCGAASGEGARFCAACGAPLVAPSDREVRKVVTILFCDLVESTKLAERFDPEALQRLLARYFVGARTIVERHGGELEVLRAALAGVEAAREVQLVTLLGEAGIGKTRLVRELAVGAAHVRLLAGRCLPYGDGITYWTLVEIVRHAAGLTGQEPADDVRARLRELVA